MKPLYILAYKDGHDPAACLMRDGEIVAAVEEERFTRIKHAPSVFPEQSIRYCLEAAGITESEVARIVYARYKPLRSAWVLFKYFLLFSRSGDQWRFGIRHLLAQARIVPLALWGEARYQKIHKLFPGLPRHIASYDHHLCHAASAYFFSGYPESLVLTFDGKGEATSTAIFAGRGLQLRAIKRYGIFKSMGLLYSSVTAHLGFTPNDGEYKVMGLAPYGIPDRQLLRGMLEPDSREGYRMGSRPLLYPQTGAYIASRLGPPREKESAIEQKHMDTAASLQDSLEESILSLARYAQSRIPSRNLCLAGGVALNIKANKRLWDTGDFDNLFVQPAAGDNGIVLGAAALLWVKMSATAPKPLEHLYFGPSYTNAQIEQAFARAGVRFEHVTDPAGAAAKLLADKAVIGWFQGRMEFGPRALGSRSVLAHPGTLEMKEHVNAKIKFRESFRPFCPSVLASDAPALFKHYAYAPYMVTSFDIAEPSVAERIPAVVHVDGTVRPQAVSAETNPLYARLIDEFKQLSGVPAVLNTSMNIRGEPIVCTPEDLVLFFKSTYVDALVAGNLVAHRSAQDPAIFKPLSRETLATEY
jgi:carbamoyltransferase